jgi:hypothetical protein
MYLTPNVGSPARRSEVKAVSNPPTTAYLVISHIPWFYRVSNDVLDGVILWSPEFGNSGAKKGGLHEIRAQSFFPL